MKKLILCILTGLVFNVQQASAAGGSLVGFNVGSGIPYLTQAGLNYVTASRNFSFELGYNALSLTATTAASSISVGLNKMEFSLRWHPFAGSFFLGAGLGQQTMYSKASETISSQVIESKVEVKSNVLTTQAGWMWGMANGGLFFGIDFGFQNPSGAKTTITTNADTAIEATTDYQTLLTDTAEQANKYGNTGFATFTFFRLGYLF